MTTSSYLYLLLAFHVGTSRRMHRLNTCTRMMKLDVLDQAISWRDRHATVICPEQAQRYEYGILSFIAYIKIIFHLKN